MKHFIVLATPITLTAGPALAHGGAHVHPHGAEVWIAAAFAAVLAVGIYAVWGRK